MKRVDSSKKIYLLPNLVTTACLFAGVYSIMRSLNGDYVVAAWAIVVAGVFDALDGRLARLTRSESDFGMQYDSLSDLTSFGIAPGILVYSWALGHFGRVGTMVTFLYVACAALRLARFNVQVSRVEKNVFLGLPVPAAAILLSTMVIFYTFIFEQVKAESTLALGLTFGLALLMVSTIRYRSFKAVDFRKRSPFYYLVGGVIFIFALSLEPRITFFVATCIYVASGFIEEVIFFQKRAMKRRARKQQVVEERRRLRRERKKKSGTVRVLQMKHPLSESSDSEDTEIL